MIDTDKIEQERKALRKTVIVYTVCLLSVFLMMMPFGAGISGAVIMTIGVIGGLGSFIIAIVLVLEVGSICKAMGEDKMKTALFQLGILVIPLGAIIFPLIVLAESKKDI